MQIRTSSFVIFAITILYQNFHHFTKLVNTLEQMNLCDRVSTDLSDTRCL